jgi:hypothetical protein
LAWSAAPSPLTGASRFSLGRAFKLVQRGDAKLLVKLEHLFRPQVRLVPPSCLLEPCPRTPSGKQANRSGAEAGILLRGGNPHRARAYTRAAENLLASPEPLGDLIASNRLRDIPGVGDTIANIVTKLHRHGAHPMLDELRKEVPHGVLEMLSIPGRPRETSAPYLRLGPLA